MQEESRREAAHSPMILGTSADKIKLQSVSRSGLSKIWGGVAGTDIVIAGVAGAEIILHT